MESKLSQKQGGAMHLAPVQHPERRRDSRLHASPLGNQPGQSLSVQRSQPPPITWSWLQRLRTACASSRAPADAASSASSSTTRRCASLRFSNT